MRAAVYRGPGILQIEEVPVPEVARGDSLSGSVASEVFTVAVGTLALLTGKPQPARADIDSPLVPEWLRPVLRQGMEPDAQKRYQTPAKFKAALERARKAPAGGR